MKKVDEKRYNEIKKIAINCINDFYNNRNGLKTIDVFMKKYGFILKSQEEILLFKTMVLFPDSVKFYIEYKNNKNINYLSKKFDVSKETINTKISFINYYEFLYEKQTKLLKISNIDVLGINSEIKKANESINRTINALKKTK